jgi:hypothetical protein
MENSNENLDTTVINLYLTNLFCVLRKYINLKICTSACINIAYRILSNGNNEPKNLELITEQMNNIIQNNEFKCDKNLTRSFLENVVIPDPDKDEWKTEQNKLCKSKNFLTCNMPGDCKYENSNCVADEAKYTIQKLEELRKNNSDNELKLNQANVFKDYVNKSENSDEWVDRISKYCNTKDDESCQTRNNGCTKPMLSDKCIPDVKDYDEKSTLNYNGILHMLEPEELEKKKKQRVEWQKMQDTLCNNKNKVDCILPNNDCKYENTKCSVDTNDYTDEKFIKLDNEKKVKEYLNKLEKPEWIKQLNSYCSNKDSVACSTKNNACTFRILKQKCEVDEGDYEKKNNLKYTDNLEQIITSMNEAEAKAAEQAKAAEVKPTV